MSQVGEGEKNAYCEETTGGKLHRTPNVCIMCIHGMTKKAFVQGAQ